MSDEPDSVLGSLPRTRPHRRSAKRGLVAPTAITPPADAMAPAKPAKAEGRAKARATATVATGAKAKAPAKAKTPVKTQTPTTAAAHAAAAPPRSLQSATRPRAAGAGSRKPGATSQAHGPRPDEVAARRRSAPPAPEPAGAVGTAVQAAAELTEIGLKAGARALRGALSRLPRP